MAKHPVFYSGVYYFTVTFSSDKMETLYQNGLSGGDIYFNASLLSKQCFSITYMNLNDDTIKRIYYCKFYRSYNYLNGNIYNKTICISFANFYSDGIFHYKVTHSPS